MNVITMDKIIHDWGIYFRAKIDNDSDFIHGILAPNKDNPNVMTISTDGHTYIPIHSATICRCTGIRDENGNLIFANDIVSFKYKDTDVMSYWIVHYSENYYMWKLRNINNTNESMPLHEIPEYFKVVGNIWDSPEMLLKKG